MSKFQLSVRAVTAALALALVVAGCGDSQFTYVASPDRRAFFKIPQDWHLFDEEAIRAHNAATATDGDAEMPDGGEAEQDAGAGAFRFLAIFDASPTPSLANDLETADHPFGLVRIRELGFSERDRYSLSSLRNEMVAVDQIANQPDATIAEIEPSRTVVLDGGLAGTRLVYSVQREGLSYAIHQIGLVDAATRVVYFFLIGCTSACFEQYGEVIEEVAESWTVKEP